MLKIGTHNSATGEKPVGLLSYLVLPFARTQGKTLKEQYDLGCRSFDLRIKKYSGEWHCAHGLYTTARTSDSIMEELGGYPEHIQVQIMYEGLEDSDLTSEFLDKVKEYKDKYSNITYGPICIKYSKEDHTNKTLEEAQESYEGSKASYIVLDGRSWHTYIPIPWLWDKLLTRPHVFNEDTYTYVDFL